MRRIGVVSLSVLALGFSVPAARAEKSLKAGEYEITTEMRMEGVDRSMPGSTVKHCYTEDDVKDLKKIAEQGQGRNRDCEISDMKTTPRGATWSMRCKSGAKGTSELAYAPDGYEMTMNMEMPGGPNGPMKMKMHSKAHRLGDCGN